jgi:putative serine protease PepD
VRLLVTAAGLALVGVVAFLVTVNRTQVTGRSVQLARPSGIAVTEPTQTPSMEEVARAHLNLTVTIEALASGAEGLGTGWLLDTKGDFVTNAHVIQGQVTVRIRGRDGSSHVGLVMGADRDLDIAVVRSRDGFAGTPLVPQPAPISSFPQPVVVVASSHATGHDDITTETASRIEADVPVTGDTTTAQPPTTTDYHDMLVLTGQKVYPGNSGGPVLDREGRVVGILTLASKSNAEAYAIQVGTVLGVVLSYAAK